MTDEVISVTPDGQIIAFPNLQKAKATLLKQYHKYIIANEIELMYKLDYEDLVGWFRKLNLAKVIKASQLDPLFEDIPLQLSISHEHAARYMWPILVMEGRRTVEKIKRKWGSKKDRDKPFIYYTCNYNYTDPVLSKLYLELPKQSQVLVDLFVENVPNKTGAKNEGWPEYRIYKMIKENKHRFNSKQDPWKIFVFYRKPLLKLGFIEQHKEV